MGADLADLSRIRQAMRARVERLRALLALLGGRSALLAASLYEHRSRCGKPQCRCARGDYRHRLWCVSFTEAGGSRTRVVAPDLKAAVAGRTGEYRRCRAARRELRRLAAELDALAARAERRRCREGRKRFRRLAAAGRRRKGAGG